MECPTAFEYAIRRIDGEISKPLPSRDLAVHYYHEARARGWQPALLVRAAPDGDWHEEPVPARLVFTPTSRYLVRGRH